MLRINLKLNWRLKTACPRHRSYDPQKHGQKFRSSCAECQELFTLNRELDKAMAALRQVQERAEKVQHRQAAAPRPARKPKTPSASGPAVTAAAASGL